MSQNQKKFHRYFHEVLAEASKMKSPAQRVKHLQEYPSFALKTVLQINFNDSIVLDLPKGDIPEGVITFSEKASQPVDRMIKIMKYFVKGNTRLDKIKKEAKFIQLLEGICEGDARAIIAAKDKELRKLYPGITPKVAKEAFPGVQFEFPEKK